MKKDNPTAEETGESRRNFLDFIGWTGFYGLIAATAGNTLRFFFPAALEEPSSVIKVGPVDFLVAGNVYLDVKRKIILNRAKDGSYYAQSPVCTHLGCLVRLQEEKGIFACPCHGSVFSLDGTVIKGPAPRDLDRLSVTLDFEGMLVIDKALIVERDYKLLV